MKKSIYCMMLALLFMGATGVKSQVTIGSQNNPHAGSVLDLSKVSGKNLGLLLPQVDLTSATSWSPVAGTKTEGMMVYNSGNVLDKGAYVWTIDSENSNGFWAKVTGSGQTVDPSLPGTWVTTGALGSGTAADPYKNTCPDNKVELTLQSGYSFGAISGGTISGTKATFTASGNVVITKGSQSGTVYVTIGSCSVVPAQPNSVSGLATVMTGATGLSYCSNQVAGATEYVWTVPAGWTITSATTGNCIAVTAPSTTGSGNITVAAKNAAGTSSVYSFPVTVISSYPDASGNYVLTGTTCLDVAQTLNSTCGTIGRTNAFASTKTFEYTLNHTTTVTNLKFTIIGATDLVKSLTWSGDVATIVFVDDIVARSTGSASGSAITLIATFKDNTSASVQKTLPLSVKDCLCCPGYLAPGGEYAGFNALGSITALTVESVKTYFTATGKDLCVYKTDANNGVAIRWDSITASGSVLEGVKCKNGTWTDGNTGWRLPNIAELAAISAAVSSGTYGKIDSGIGAQPTATVGTYNMKNTGYWASTIASSSTAWVWFYSSTAANSSGSWSSQNGNTYLARCVRSN